MECRVNDKQLSCAYIGWGGFSKFTTSQFNQFTRFQFSTSEAGFGDGLTINILHDENETL